MFTTYSLKTVSNDGTEMRLYVGCLRQEVELAFFRNGISIDGEITEPDFSEVDTPGKAEEWINRHSK